MTVLDVYVGTVGERLVLKVKVTKVQHIESDWGVSTLIVMVDEAGNRFKWFASGSLDWKVDSEMTIKASIRKHEEYKGVKMTALTRCAEYVEKVKKPRAKKVAKEQQAMDLVGEKAVQS